MAVIEDGSAVNGQAVDVASKAARVRLFDALGNRITKNHGQSSVATDEGLIIAGVNDGNVRHLRMDRLGSLAIASSTLLLTESFEGTTLPAARWSVAAVTMTALQTAASGHQLNNGAITTVNTGYLLRSLRSFPKQQRAPLQLKIRARVAHIANSVAEFGFGDTSTFNGANTNGAYWQYTAGGVVQPVLTYNGVDTFAAAVTGLNPVNYYTWDIILDDDSAMFTVQDTVTGELVAERTIFLPLTQPKLWAATRLFAFVRLFNTASAPATAPTLIVSTIDGLLLDAATSKPWKEQLAGSGYGASYQPVSQAQAAQWANNAAPGNATLSNTAAGYSTLGGLFSFAAVAGAASDYILFGFQVPSPYLFVCTGVEIELWNTGAAVATTPTLFVWGLGVDQLAVSLAGTIARVGLGAQDLPVGAAVGARAARLAQSFDVPLVTNPGRFLTLILRMPVGTATASEIFQGMANIRGYFE